MPKKAGRQKRAAANRALRKRAAKTPRQKARKQAVEKTDSEASALSMEPGYLYDPVACRPRRATDEEYVRQEMIRTLAGEYGYPLTSLETEFKIKMGSARKKCDIAVFDDGEEHVQENVRIIVECKKPVIKPTDAEQGVDYVVSYVAASPACEYGLWTNGAGYARQVLHKSSKGRIKYVDYDIPRHGQARLPDKASKLDDLVPASTESLKWRFRKCHDIITNAGVDKMTAFWEFLKLIQTKIENEKQAQVRVGFYATPEETESQDGHTRVAGRIERLYQKAVLPRYKKMGFSGDTISLRPAVLTRIVAELQDYALLATGPIVKGAAYEEIVGANLRGNKGEFFTPRPVIEMAVSMLSVRPEDICLDPACGSGGFSTLMLLAGLGAIEKRYSHRKGDFSSAITDEQKRFGLEHVISNDINPNLANACRMNMLMNHDGSSMVFDQDILDPPEAWTCERAKELRGATGLRRTSRGRRDFLVGEITALCTNPPFGDNITRTERNVLDQYDLGRGRAKQIVEILFVERCVQFLKPGSGRAAIVVPQSILNNPGLEYVRQWLFSQCRVLAVVELPVETFLTSGREGTGTLTAVLIVERRTLGETLSIIGGATPEAQPIYMAIAHGVGYTRRGKTLYRRNDDGTDVLVDVELTNQVTGLSLGTSKERVVNNDLPAIAADYLRFREHYLAGRVYYDAREEVYRVIA